MARIRTVKPEFWTSEQIVECSPTARLLFIGLWNFCDDAGRHPASVKRAKMEVFPADPFTYDDIDGWISELCNAGLIQQYEAQGKVYWQVTGWHHQKIDRPTIRHPAPEDSPTPRRTLDEDSPTPHPRTGTEGTGDGRDGKGMERNGDGRRPVEFSLEEFRRVPSVLETDLWTPTFDQIVDATGPPLTDQDKRLVTATARVSCVWGENWLGIALKCLVKERLASGIENPFAYLTTCLTNKAADMGRDFPRMLRELNGQPFGETDA